MNLQRPPPDPVFILRFWRESIDGAEEARWRVQVHNINTGHRDIVDDIDGAFTIVTANLNGETGEPRDAAAQRPGVSGGKVED